MLIMNVSVSVHIINSLLSFRFVKKVKDRLNEQDCIECGWLLDRFPCTPTQAEALTSAGVTADCFIFIN